MLARRVLEIGHVIDHFLFPACWQFGVVFLGDVGMTFAVVADTQKRQVVVVHIKTFDKLIISPQLAKRQTLTKL